MLFAVTSASLAFAGGRSRHKDSGDVQILHVTPGTPNRPTWTLAPPFKREDRFIVFGDVFRNAKQVEGGAATSLSSWWLGRAGAAG